MLYVHFFFKQFFSARKRRTFFSLSLDRVFEDNAPTNKTKQKPKAEKQEKKTSPRNENAALYIIIIIIIIVHCHKRFRSLPHAYRAYYSAYTYT